MKPIVLLTLLTAATPVFADAPSAALGAQVFKTRCVACHGPLGKGDGAGGRALPVRPANLGMSKAPDDYLKLMILEGGDAMGRSSAMPAWGSVLTSVEVDSVLLHVNTLRK